ncbi:MAG TPA: DUF4258 domain-containing protein [Pirellulaceae bacterium]|nr:DUF4258 domain-containing protein [Pirellulaceae bacterium]
MSQLWQQFAALITAGDVRISEHGYDALADDGLTVDDILFGIGLAIVVEVYLDYPKGAAVLVLQRAIDGSPVHAVWGVPRGYNRPAVLVTAYRPAPNLWDETFTRRLRP